MRKSDSICIVSYHAYMEKAPVAAGGPFWAFLHSFVRPNYWVSLGSFARRRLKNWISVGDQITGSPGFFHVYALICF